MEKDGVRRQCMRIFNQDKTKEITKYDKSKHYLVEDKLFIKHHEAVAEIPKQSHYTVIQEYPNGGKDVEEIIDVEYQPAKDAYDEYEDIFVLKAYTDKELAQQEIYEVESWFTWYDMQVMQYNRCIRLGVQFDKDINELDAQANTNAARLKQLKEQIGSK